MLSVFVFYMALSYWSAYYLFLFALMLTLRALSVLRPEMITTLTAKPITTIGIIWRLNIVIRARECSNPHRLCDNLSHVTQDAASMTGAEAPMGLSGIKPPVRWLFCF